MVEQVVKQRITYVDAMKGLSILLVVLLHCHGWFGDILYNPELNNMLRLLRLPLFFCLSGLFFKRLDGFRPFVTKKINQLVIPYFFLALIPFCLFAFLYNDRYDDPIFYLLAVLRPYNLPLWFLRVLFLVYILYYVIDKYTSSKSFCVQLSVAFSMLVIAFLINRLGPWIKEIFTLPDDIFILFNEFQYLFKALFFFFVAQQVKKRGWIRFSLKWSYTILLFLVLFVISWYLSGYCGGGVAPNNLALHGLYFLLQQLCSLCMIFAIALLFAKIKFTKALEFYGKNSLVILGNHYLSIILLRTYTNLSPYWIFFITVFLMLPCIFFFNKYLPQFVAKKDFFKLKS